MSVKNRVFKSLAANSFGQAVTIFSQIILIPFFISAWGAEKYGEWLMLSAIPSYLILADMGIGSSAANDMTMAVGSDNRTSARQIFYTMSILLAKVSVAVILLILTICAGISFFNLIHLKTISSLNTLQIITVLGLGVCLSFYMSLIFAGYRASGRNALGIFLGNIIRLLEIGLTVIGLFLHFSPLLLCLVNFIFRLVATLAPLFYLRTIETWLFFGAKFYDKNLLRRLIKPSIGFLVGPLGSALTLQAPILIIGSVIGGEAVTLFTTMRTISRVPYQIMSAFIASIAPEVSLAYGAQNFTLLRKLHRKSWGISLMLVLLTSLLIALFGEQVTNLWLGKKIVYDSLVLHGLLAVTLASSMWAVSSVILTSVNAHLRMSLVYFALTTISTLTMALVSIHFGMLWVLVTMLITELMMMLYVLPKVVDLTKDNYWSFFKSSILFN